MGLTQVNSEGIKDGEIKDADVNASAAIAGSKLAAATTSAAGSMSAADKTKLDGVATSATANPSAPALTGSTNNQITTVTGANAIQGEANLTFDGSTFSATGISHFNVAEAEVDIKSTGSGSKRSLRLLNADASADNKIGIYFGPANNVVGAGIYGIAESDFTTTANRDGALGFETRQDGNWNEAMRIASTGAVTKPKQPRFCAEKNGSGSTTTTANATQVFQTESLDVGGHYNNSTGVFTAPVTGHYYFYVQMLGGNNDSRVMFFFNKNDSSNLMEISGTTDNYNSIKGSLLCPLAANDTMRIKNENSTVDLYQDAGYQNHFMGWLVA